MTRLASQVTLLATCIAATAAAQRSDSAPRVVNVVALDYTFQVPRELPAGPTTFRFANGGRQPHELNIYLIRAGVTMESVLALLRANKSVQQLTDGPVGVLFARRDAASAGGLYTDLLPGRDYAVICILRDSVTAPRHFMLGMYSMIHVTPARAATASRRMLPVDTIMGMDYAYKYPATLPPGPHAFAFRNDGKVRHEMSIAGLKPGITLDSLMRTERGNGRIARLIATDFGLLHVPAGQQALGMLETNLAAGTEYVLFCFFTDSAGAPTHAQLGMVGSIHVTPR